MRKAIVASLLIGALAVVGLAYEGTIVFQGGHGAKALGMGGAFCAIADDATGALWNPAGLAFSQPWIGGATANLFTAEGFGGVGYQYVSGGFVYEGYAIGLGWANATAGELYNASLYLGTVGIKIADFGSVGVNIKYYSETIDQSTDSGFGFDIGILIPLTEDIDIGIVAKDVGGTSLAEGQKISPMYEAGMAAKLLDGVMTLAGDVDVDGEAFSLSGARAGVEFTLVENLAVRAGVVFPGADFSSYYFTLGAGVALGDLSIDAAYLLQGEPGDSLVLSATFLMGNLLGGGEEQPQEQPSE